jgi:FkbM family methyltransferase
MSQCIQANKGQPFKGVLHIGAHHGEEAQDYANSGIRNVLWVEANPYIMKDLYDHTKFVSIKSKYLNEVLSDEDNVDTHLNIANNGQSSSILELGTHAVQYPHIHYTKKVPVKTKRFDTVYRENRIELDLDQYDFINLDVQGAELKVLKGFGNLFEKFPFRAVYTEVNFEELYKDCCMIEELDQFLGEHGFQRVLTAAPEQTWGDSLYLRNV